MLNEIVLNVDREYKTIDVTGKMAAGETPSVTIVLKDCENIVSGDGLRLRLRYNRADVAVFPDPNNADDAWDYAEAEDGSSTFTGKINLNTTKLMDVFSGASDRSEIPFILMVDYDNQSTIDRIGTLHAQTIVRLLNWTPAVSSNPISYESWRDNIESRLKDAETGVSSAGSGLAELSLTVSTISGKVDDNKSEIGELKPIVSDHITSISTLTTSVSTNAENIAQEILDRTDADNTLQGNIDTVSDAVDAANRNIAKKQDQLTPGDYITIDINKKIDVKNPVTSAIASALSTSVSGARTLREIQSAIVQFCSHFIE